MKRCEVESLKVGYRFGLELVHEDLGRGELGSCLRFGFVVVHQEDLGQSIGQPWELF